MKVLITGASSGMGRDFARILAITSDEMVLVARNEERLEKLKKELTGRFEITVKTVVMDLSKKENCIKLYEENKDVDFLINNAGFGDTGNFHETSLEKDVEMINTNVTACHILTKLYLKDMMAADKGHILNVASIAGFMPGPLMATYYATKSYVVRLSEAVREEIKKNKSNVKISILCPGPVDTNFKNAANVDFVFNGMDSFAVAKYALVHLNRFYIVPGVGIKMARIVAQMIPSSVAAKVVYMLQSMKEEKEE